MNTTTDAAFTKVSVTCYHAVTTDSICAGGGDFDRILYSPTDPNCFQRSGLDNGATLIQDSAGNCFYRKNFGLNGIVDARQCGVYGDGLTHTPFSDETLLQNCLNVAANLAVLPLPNIAPVVTTGGGNVLIDSADLTIPANVGLTCGGDPGGQRPQLAQGGGATPYYTLPKSIILNPAHKILRSANAHFFGCLIRPDWYNDSLFFDGSGNQLINNTRDVLDKIEHSFTGTATRCDSGPCAMDHMFIFGFRVCDETTNAPYAQLENLVEECVTDGCKKLPRARRGLSHCIDPRTDIPSWGRKNAGAQAP